MDKKNRLMEKKWYVVYTKPKCEKKVEEELIKKEIECYCPKIIQLRKWTDRIKKVEVPLFNSYVFVRLEEKDRNQVFQSPAAVRYLFWLGKPAIVKNEEIEAIKEWLSAPDKYSVSVEGIKVGDKITVISGPFVSQKGVVQEVSKQYYTLVLESLGCVLKINYNKKDEV